MRTKKEVMDRINILLLDLDYKQLTNVRDYIKDLKKQQEAKETKKEILDNTELFIGYDDNIMELPF